jgi:uncharacterized protein with HEPN domain
MRNRRAHGYDAVSPPILFNVARHDLGRSTNLVRACLADGDRDDP